MITSLAITSLYVLDQDEALDFYVGTLGLEIGTDADLGFMRFLTVRVPGETREVLLERPGAPSMDDATAGQVRDLVTKGAAGTLFFQTDDVQGLWRDLQSKGVELPEEPVDRGYGTDFGFRDPFGNHVRVSQPPR
ncbi:putative glyoxalase superfamily protein PhnB [Terracoccus luteus]|jgi:catechol 2,3-dioxygenase-like lactoylglutathione lyase family enzyme|uniref:Putative glyoxalase superfamily protein PhnB n=1 Tax=Terracoccus luteus TaxID=53356 RepID=A0A495XY63_9MICO|nr:VOC family protein [Terracoccus luteus]RKT79227.1 putative glyoxalase superfamily protein PhnB [Terracoccus luteus]